MTRKRSPSEVSRARADAVLPRLSHSNAIALLEAAMRVGMAGEDWQKLVNAGFTPALTKNHEVVLVRPVQRDDNQPATRAFQNALARGDWRAMMKGAPKD